MRDVLVLDATDEPLAVLDARRAVVLVLAGTVDLVVADGDRRAMRSPSVVVPLPAVVRLRRLAPVPRQRPVPLSRQAVLLRDRYECAYCVERWADTVDHIVPRARGGPRQWRNLVAACTQCNQRKGDRLLGELGWRLRFQPVVPTEARRLRVARAAPEWAPYLAWAA
jgi:5-methylcytosine-specific restriction endonuclease McrA